MTSGAPGRVVATVVSVNVGAPRTVDWQGRRVRSAIWKEPADGPVEVRGVNLAGDDQADRRVHGGEDKAVYAYGADDYRWWSDQLGVELGPGTFGENLTVDGYDLRGAGVGERWRVGSCVLEVSEPRSPCFKLGMRMGTADFVELFDVVGRYGTYLRIVEEGAVTAGDAVEVVVGPRPPLTVSELAQARRSDDAELLARVAAHPAVSPRWADGARRRLHRVRSQGRAPATPAAG
ncbi:MAG: MOSC domain-containing protein [Acidimicrobiia bacterium]